MKKKILILSVLLALGACAKTPPDLSAPCPDYGSHCRKVPINNWNTNQV